MDISLLFTVLFAVLILSVLFNSRATAIEELEYSAEEGEKMDFSVLRKAVEEVESVDGHCHNIVAFDSNSVQGFIQAFTVGAFGDAEAFAFAQQSLSFKRSLRDIAKLYGTGLSLESVEEYRRVSGIQSITSTCFKAARFSAILMDDGIDMMDKVYDIEWHKTFAPFVGRILRTERVAEKILEQVRYLHTFTFNMHIPLLVKFSGFRFLSIIVTVANEIYALKSIAAYYGGLEINLNVAKTDAEEDLRQLLNAGKPLFLLNYKSLVSYIFLQSLEVSLSYDLPMQIHTGFGDKLLDLRKSNPLHFRAVLEDKRYSKCRFVYLDFGLAIPKLSVHGMISAVKDLLNLAPLSKVMFSTDAYTFPETFYLGAKNSREVVFSVLRDACINGDLSLPEAVEAAKDIFARNAIRFYNISSAKVVP
ncbi:hypothetical protein Fmac_027565 [Flemingia macrophylla]|uniref:Amidohydrolase-related domain-containing protein n=1 Tax=Flemingia macrophylla TaxID=520843 RepID=A0ABD1LI30_9FABA